MRLYLGAFYDFEAGDRMPASRAAPRGHQQILAELTLWETANACAILRPGDPQLS